MSVQAVILAGGEGMRLRPLTRNRPKVLLPVANRPILGYVLDAVVSAGIRDITIIVGYQKEQVLKFLNDYPLPVKVVVQQKQLGVYHALSCALPEIHSERVLVVSGDNYLDTESICSLLWKKNAILASPHQRPQDYGVILQQGEYVSSLVPQHTESRHGALVSCGAYVVEKPLLEKFILADGPENLSDLHDSQISVVQAHEWFDADIPEDFIRLNAHLLRKQKTMVQGTVDKYAVIRKHVVIGKNVSIGPGVVITGPAYIGDDCIIHPNVCVGPGTSLGSRVVEPFTYITNSILMNDCFVGAQSRISDSIIGEGCVIHQAATVSEDFGAVIGDRTTIGAFTRLKCCLIGNNVSLDGGRLIDSDIPDNTRVM